MDSDFQSLIVSPYFCPDVKHCSLGSQAPACLTFRSASKSSRDPDLNGGVLSLDNGPGWHTEGKNVTAGKTWAEKQNHGGEINSGLLGDDSGEEGGLGFLERVRKSDPREAE